MAEPGTNNAEREIFREPESGVDSVLKMPSVKEIKQVVQAEEAERLAHPNKSMRNEMAAYAMVESEKRLRKLSPWLEIDSGDAGGIGLHPELYSDEPLSADEQKRYQDMLLAKKAQSEITLDDKSPKISLIDAAERLRKDPMAGRETTPKPEVFTFKMPTAEEIAQKQKEREDKRAEHPNKAKKQDLAAFEIERQRKEDIRLFGPRIGGDMRHGIVPEFDSFSDDPLNEQEQAKYDDMLMLKLVDKSLEEAALKRLAGTN